MVKCTTARMIRKMINPTMTRIYVVLFLDRNGFWGILDIVDIVDIVDVDDDGAAPDPDPLEYAAICVPTS